MLIGLLSDSHANTHALKRGVSLLMQEGAEVLVHCGDIDAVDHVSILAHAGAPAYLVAGNMDRPTGKLAKEAKKCGVQFAANFIEVPLGEGEYLIALHGDNEQLLIELVEGGQFPYICHGHTHQCADQTFGTVRVICPGALAHPRKPKYPTVAILDTESDTVRFIKVA
jgi:putative phosphoesterase